VVFWRAQKTAGGERSEHATSLWLVVPLQFLTVY